MDFDKISAASDASTHAGLLLGWTDPPTRSGKNSAFAEPLWADSGDGHLITIAPTGAGKGVSCIIPALLTWPGPAVVIDPKGENYAVTGNRRRMMGQRVYVVDPFRITGRVRRSSINPLHLINRFNGMEEDDAAMIASLLATDKVSHHEPFWDERASSVISSAILQAINLKLSADCNLGHAKALIDEFVASLTPCGTSVPVLRSPRFVPKGIGMERTLMSVMATIASHMSFMRSREVRRSLSKNPVPLADVMAGMPMTIYLVLPPDKLDSHASLLRLWLGTLITALARRKPIPETPTLFLIDEAAHLGQLDSLRSALTLMRGYGVKVWTFWQDLAQLRRVYPRDWESLLTNSTTQQIFGASNPASLTQLSDYLGQYLPRPLSTLKADQTILIRPGMVPDVVRRCDYRRDGMFIGMADANPFHAKRGVDSGDNVVPFPCANRDRRLET